MLVDSRRAVPADLPVPKNAQMKPAGVLIDTGTGKRIPFAVWADMETGEYEALTPAPNGVDYHCDLETGEPLRYRGRARGRLELVSAEGARDLAPPPRKVTGVIEPMSPEQKRHGVEQYKRVYFEVWQFRGESKRVVDTRFADYLAKSNFLDAFVLRRHVPTGGSIHVR